MLRRTLAGLFARLLFIATAFTSCGGGSGSVCDEVEGRSCPECFGELTRCAFDGVEVTAQSCEGCQARMGLLLELCASGSEASGDEVEAGMTCEVVDDTAVESP